MEGQHQDTGAGSEGTQGDPAENLPAVSTADRERTISRCPGRRHMRHVLSICEGSCRTSCGGPIDIDSGCRCYP